MNTSPHLRRRYAISFRSRHVWPFHFGWRIDCVAHGEQPCSADGHDDVYAFVKQQGKFLPARRTPGVSTCWNALFQSTAIEISTRNLKRWAMRS
ncbi:hypothetical protein EV401DRAFT_1995079 [Pisolithus croceorrhizus]|nr:hypothetical protein EV401DRAFT_1995079 [Pisolithus croceorrhizus]